MDVNQAIQTRRSVRKYLNRPVSKAVVLEILEAANLAPSATNRQPWEFVVANRLHIERLEGVLAEAFRERVAGVGEAQMRAAIRELSCPTTRPATRSRASARSIARWAAHRC